MHGCGPPTEKCCLWIPSWTVRGILIANPWLQFLFVDARLTIACCEPLAGDFWLKVQGCILSAVDSCLRIEGLLGESWKTLVLTFSFLGAAGPNSKTFYGPGDRNLYKNEGTHRNVSAYI